MTLTPFSITLHMVASLDGFIAKPDNSITWFETTSAYDKGIDAQDPEMFLKTIDCYIMGANTYQFALALSKTYGWAYGDKPTIVLTNRLLPNDKPNVRFYTGSLAKLVTEHLQPQYKNVWVVGGAAVAKDFLQQQLINEIRMTILPILLGEGLSFFSNIKQEQILQLIDAKAYKNGMVEVCYKVNK